MKLFGIWREIIHTQLQLIWGFERKIIRIEITERILWSMPLTDNFFADGVTGYLWFLFTKEFFS